MRYGKIVNGVMTEEPIERRELKLNGFLVLNPQDNIYQNFGYYTALPDNIPACSEYQYLSFSAWQFDDVDKVFFRVITAEYKNLEEVRRIKDNEIGTKCVEKIDVVLSAYNREYAQARMTAYLNILQQGGSLTTEQQADKENIESQFLLIASIRAESDAIRSAIQTETDIQTIINMDFAE